MIALEAVNVRSLPFVRSPLENFKITRGALIQLLFFAANGFPKLKIGGFRVSVEPSRTDGGRLAPAP
jgi:hypothetical protein